MALGWLIFTLVIGIIIYFFVNKKKRGKNDPPIVKPENLLEMIFGQMLKLQADPINFCKLKEKYGKVYATEGIFGIYRYILVTDDESVDKILKTEDKKLSLDKAIAEFFEAVIGKRLNQSQAEVEDRFLRMAKGIQIATRKNTKILQKQ